MKFKKTGKKGNAEMEGVIIGSNSSFRPSKKMLFIGGGVVLIAVLGWFAYKQLVSNENSATKSSNSCVKEDGLLAEAQQLFTYDEVDALGQVAGRIQSLNEYEQDPNCLFVLVRFNILSNNAGEARQYLEKYKTISGTSSLDPALGENPATIDELEQEVAATEKFKDEIKSNGQYF